MSDLVFLLVLPLSSYGFATAVELLRGSKLNFKPFNCKFCLSWWYSVGMLLAYSKSIAEAILLSFFSSAVCLIIKSVTSKPDPLGITDSVKDI